MRIFYGNGDQKLLLWVVRKNYTARNCVERRLSMRKSIVKHLAYALLAVALITVLGACSSSEEKAQLKYDEAARIEQSSTSDAEVLYRQVLADYPATPAAQLAQAQLTALQEKRQLTIKQAAFAALDSVQKVVEGYRSMAHRWPQSIKDFDEGDYFFDSAYMAESVSNGFTVYLALVGEAGYRLWSLPNEGDAAFRLDDKGRALVGVDRAELLVDISSAYRVEAEKGALVFLVPRS